MVNYREILRLHSLDYSQRENTANIHNSRSMQIPALTERNIHKSNGKQSAHPSGISSKRATNSFAKLWLRCCISLHRANKIIYFSYFSIIH